MSVSNILVKYILISKKEKKENVTINMYFAPYCENSGKCLLKESRVSGEKRKKMLSAMLFTMLSSTMARKRS